MSNILEKQVKETDIMNTICQYLEYKRYCFWRSNNIPAFSIDKFGKARVRSMPKYTPKGLPDITLILKGKYYGLEVKRQGRYQTPEQKNIEKLIKENGGEYYVVRSLNDIYSIGL